MRLQSELISMAVQKMHRNPSLALVIMDFSTTARTSRWEFLTSMTHRWSTRKNSLYRLPCWLLY